MIIFYIALNHIQHQHLFLVVTAKISFNWGLLNDRSKWLPSAIAVINLSF